MSGFEEFLRDNPVAVLSLVLGLGYLVGKTSIRGFEPGSVTGVLLVGLVFGSLGFEPNPMVQTIGFTLFIFSVGLGAGPSFFSVIREDGLKYFSLALLIGGTGFTLAVVLARTLGLEPGAAAGLLAGGLTSSPTLAAAQGEVRSGAVQIPGFSPEQLLTNISSAYAITYIFGLVGLILIIRFLPGLLGLDLPAEAKKLEASRRGAVEDRVHALNDIVVRAYRITNAEVDGVSVGRVYEELPGRLSVEKLRRGGEFVPVTPETPLQLGDEVCLVGFLDEFATREGIGPELPDPELLDVSIESARVVLLRTKMRRLTTSLADITARGGCFVSRIERGGVELPLEGELDLQAADVVHVTGPATRVEEVGRLVGHVERATEETDLLTFALGITVGLLVGAWTVRVAGFSIGLGSAGGLLASGLAIGYLRALHPTFGRVPAAARWIFMEAGLMTFMAGVGLRAGSGIVETLVQSGIALVLAGVVVTTTPVFVGYLFGRLVLRLNPVLLLGAVTGSMTSGACLSIVNDEAQSSIPALGYTGAYAFANVFLTMAGSVILRL